MMNTQRYRTDSARMNTATSVGLEHRTTWSIAAQSAVRIAQTHIPVTPAGVTAVVTAAPVNWETIRRHQRR